MSTPDLDAIRRGSRADLDAALDTARCALADLEETAEALARAVAALSTAIRHAEGAIRALDLTREEGPT